VSSPSYLLRVDLRTEHASLVASSPPLISSEKKATAVPAVATLEAMFSAATSCPRLAARQMMSSAPASPITWSNPGTLLARQTPALLMRRCPRSLVQQVAGAPHCSRCPYPTDLETSPPRLITSVSS